MTWAPPARRRGCALTFLCTARSAQGLNRISWTGNEDAPIGGVFGTTTITRPGLQADPYRMKQNQRATRSIAASAPSTDFFTSAIDAIRTSPES